MPSSSSAERRGADRAKNVTRPTFGAMAAKARAPTPGAFAASRTTDKDDGWTSFRVGPCMGKQGPSGVIVLPPKITVPEHRSETNKPVRLRSLRRLIAMVSCE